MNIDSIQNGVVLDHIQAGKSMDIYKYLHLDELDCYVKEEALKKKGIPYTQTTDLESVIPQLDILYMTRVQKERFFNEEDYLRLKDSYILTPEKLVNAKADLSILHPLPRVNEIAVAVDKDPRAAYWRQVKNGKFIRMALIMKLLGIQV